MIGRQVIKSGRTWANKEELLAFMEENWDKEQYGEFVLEKPTKASLSEYICLPATNRFMVIMYPKKEKVVLSVCDTPEGVASRAVQSIPQQGSVIASMVAMADLYTYEKERKGPAEDVLQEYTAYMKRLLGVK